MKRFLILSTLALALTGCASVTGLPQINPAQADAVVQKVQDISAKTCSFVPTATTIANIIATFTGGSSVIDLASSVAQGICSAINAPPKLGRRGRAAPPTYRGVVIKGRSA